MSNTGTDGETIETSCLWNEKGSGQVQMIWAIQEWSFTTAATSYNVYTFNQLRSGTWSHQTPSRWSKRSHHTNTLRLPAKPVDMNYTWHCAVMCTPVDLFHPQRSVQSAADVASPAQRVEHDTRPTPFWLLWGRKCWREEKPNPGWCFLSNMSTLFWYFPHIYLITASILSSVRSVYSSM